MSGRRYDRILSGTALALILAAPLAAGAQVADTPTNGKVAAAFTERYPAEQNPAQSPVVELRGATDQPVSSPSAPAAANDSVPDALAALDPADRAVAQKVRDLLAAEGEKLFVNEKERAAVEAFYEGRNLAPLWLDKGAENARAKVVIARLKHADADGLNPRDYATPDLGATATVAPEILAEAELKLTQVVLTYAAHVQAGRFPYSRVSNNNIGLPQKPPEPADVLAAIAGSADIGKALDAFSPPQEPYRKLKAKLAELRDNSGAKVSGRDKQIETIIANMERWRWYPRDLGEAHVLVNEPDFTLRVMHNGEQVWRSRIVIGETSKQTPLLSETMKSITVNPTWHVPPSIVHNEYLPALAQDRGVLARMGLRLSHVNGEVQITQPPGPDNALGQIRFNFPNKFLVYQHDARREDKYMFGQKVRAYSHGCMRVQDPAKYAEVLLGIARPDDHWAAEKIRGMFGNGDNDKELQLQPVPIWVHLTYQTAFVDETGKLEIRRDLYHLDSRTLAALKSGHEIVEPSSERKREPEVAAKRQPQVASRQEAEVASEQPRALARAHVRSHARHKRAPSVYQSYYYGASAYGGSFPPRPIYR